MIGPSLTIDLLYPLEFRGRVYNKNIAAGPAYTSRLIQRLTNATCEFTEPV